ncbi:hypothetical protein COCMIDRAFT_32944 [Bipolaris oryzae ATCC 44560]|uniref:Uncharacterized protein n=1 Tax=Bipolaris oryzae ATCC 44560 TaxID=930090 RepID=W6ZIF3_COCMI|nr:uncharacterized protein COCMIDRAFT_32944 [Bipolaris oryzae ATCC 44560]EUC49728.1 hypothetical protein COCMIDRAFT_32944 [Bipolaris oryzae ATCC 44560]
MDLYVAQLPGLSVATHLSRELAQENNMPDGRGWRLGHSKHPKKQTKISSLRSDGERSTATEDQGDRPRQPSWLKTLHSSRSQTPVSTLTAGTAVEDIEYGRRERLEMAALYRDSKPKLSRYTSLFASFKDSARIPDFSEPWSEEAPRPFEAYVDPLLVTQSVRLHITSSSSPIPTEHHSGLLRVFEDYRKVRDQKEHLEMLLEETLRDWSQAQIGWSYSEDAYHAEIRRLELLIARGASGMMGLVQARQGSVVDRQRRHRKTSSHDSLARDHRLLPEDKLDAEINRLSDRGNLIHPVLHGRPVSPSSKMAVLSKRFSNTSELLVGTPPDSEKTTLSRHVQSELDLSTMRKARPPSSVTGSDSSDFSARSGDALSDETSIHQTEMQPATECNAFIALRELGTLVARRRGLQPDIFNHKLMMLLSEPMPEEPSIVLDNEADAGAVTLQDINVKKQALEQGVTQTRIAERLHSQPQLSAHQGHRRQFSFEPGADELQALFEEATLDDMYTHYEGPEDSVAQVSSHTIRYTPVIRSERSRGSTQSSRADFGNMSDYPSPAPSLGRSSQGSSTSSSEGMDKTYQEGRRGSQSSVVTAFREDVGSGRVQPRDSGRRSSLASSHTGSCLSVSRDDDDSSGTGLDSGSQAGATASTRKAGDHTSRGESSSAKSTMIPPPPTHKRQGFGGGEDKGSEDMAASG